MKKLVISLAILFGLSLPAAAATFSFEGAFTSDNNVQLFDFRLKKKSKVTLKTLHSDGGTFAHGEGISAGGFTPLLFLYNNHGELLDFDEGLSFDPKIGDLVSEDAKITRKLSAGRYILALTQFDNFPNSLWLQDGFAFDGIPSFTNDIFSCGGSFCDLDGSLKTGNWAVEISNVKKASARISTTIPAPVPLPASGLLLVVSLIGSVHLLGRRAA